MLRGQSRRVQCVFREDERAPNMRVQHKGEAAKRFQPCAETSAHAECSEEQGLQPRASCQGTGLVPRDRVNIGVGESNGHWRVKGARGKGMER